MGIYVKSLLSAEFSTGPSMLSEFRKLCYKIGSDKSKVLSIKEIDSLLRSSSQGLKSNLWASRGCEGGIVFIYFYIRL